MDIGLLIDNENVPAGDGATFERAGRGECKEMHLVLLGART